MPALVIDEAAFIEGAGSTSDADAIYRAATPALAQFRDESFTLLASSPWAMIGRFHDAYQEALEIDIDTGQAIEPDSLVLQLPSDELYKDWEQAHQIEQWPGGPMFDPITRPIFYFTPELERMRRRDPDRFATEYLAAWAASQAAYFPPDAIDRAFGAYQGSRLYNRERRDVQVAYYCHADPGLSGSAYAMAIGHSEVVNGEVHVIIDRFDQWRPEDFGGRVLHSHVRAKIYPLLETFRPTLMSLDQYNSELMVNDLQEWSRRDNLGVDVVVVPATESEKFNRYELTKNLMLEGRLHLPQHQAARDEFRFLQIHGHQLAPPTTGQVRRDDMVDSTTWVVDHCLGPTHWAPQALSNTRPVATRLDTVLAPWRAERDGRRRGAGFINPARFDHRPKPPRIH